MESVLIGIGLLMIAATALPLIRRDDWWIRVFDFPRLQITAALAATLVGYLLARGDPGLAEHIFLGALVLALGYQALRMYPYTPLHRKQVQNSRLRDDDTSIGLAFVNVLMTNRDAAAVLREVRRRDPDVILAVEADAWWEAQLAELERTHSFVVKQVQDNTYGMVLYSRLTLRDARVKFLIDDDVPSIHATVRLRSGVEARLHCVHPRPPAPQENERSTERDAELLVVGREIRKSQAPAIVIGDMNDVAWSRTNDLFQRISGLLDPRVGRGFFATFNANWPPIRFPLDHIFHSRHFRLAAFERLGRCGSDHFPVYAKLSFEHEAKHEQPQPVPAPGDRREAQEKIAEARES